MFLLFTFVCRPGKICLGACGIPKCAIGIAQVCRSSNLYLRIVFARQAERFFVVFDGRTQIPIWCSQKATYRLATGASGLRAKALLKQGMASACLP